MSVLAQPAAKLFGDNMSPKGSKMAKPQETRPQVTLEQTTQNCIDLANNGDYDGFFAKIRTAALNTRQTLWGCGQITSDNRTELLKRVTSSDDRVQFALKVAENLEIPAGSFDGIGRSDPDDYLEARMFLLLQIDRQNPSPRTVRNFYPEFTGTLRERMANIAIYNSDLHQRDQQQIVFFSLGGRFSWGNAEGTTTYHTTCGIFARACMVAAGYRKRTDWDWVSGKGIFQLVDVSGDNDPAYVLMRKRSGQLPRKGDIFHIETEGLNDDHMGVLTNNMSIGADGAWTCTSVQGGSNNGTDTTANHSTSFRVDTRGTVWFDNRPLRGWIDIEKHFAT
jgi:hypothetical protein